MNKKLALVLSGGGARGAYEAGIIHYIRTMLPRESRDRVFDLVCGSSVGALNACFVAATSHNSEYQGKRLYEIWKNLRQEDIYQRGFGSLSRLFLRTAVGVIGKMLRLSPKALKSNQGIIHFKGLMNIDPFPRFLQRVVPWKQIALNVHNKVIEAVCVTATNVHTGKIEFFIDKSPETPYTGKYKANFGNLEPKHAMASGAIPIVFPSVAIGGQYYCDGSLRLNTPMSPAIHMGAEKVLVIGLHNIDERAESMAPDAVASPLSPPTLGQLAGQIMKTIFVDRLDYDIEQMKRINQLIGWGTEVYGKDFIDKINAFSADEKGEKYTSGRGLRTLDVTSIFPSQDVKKIFSDCLDRQGAKLFIRGELTAMERMILNVMDVDVKQGLDFLTFILFVPKYLEKLMDLGFEDARAKHDDLVAFFSPEGTK